MQHADPEDYAEVQEGLDPNQVHEVSCSLQLYLPCIEDTCMTDKVRH